MTTMKAIVQKAYGGPEVLELIHVPIPQPSSDEILVRVHAAGVNPVDWKIREGYLKELLQVTFPLIPGWDVAGTVAGIGDNVKSVATGESVFACAAIPRNGTYAEYVLLKEDEVAIMPESLDFLEAAAVPLAALTAWQSLLGAAGLKAGQKVLIHAAAGGVGHYATQFAKWVGAHVVATASSRNHDFLRGIGAHETIDYTKKPFEKEAKGIDVVFDTIGGNTWERSLLVLKKGGCLVSILHPPPSQEEMTKFGIRGKFVFVQPSAKELGEISALIDSDHVKPHIEKVFPLAEAGKAQELSQSGHVRGKIVLQVVG